MTGTAVSGPRTPEEVWERYARPARWSDWAPQIRGVEAPVDRVRAGLRGRVLGWCGLSVDFEVDSWDDERHQWSWTVRPRLAVPPARLPVLHLRHGVRRTAEGSQAWLTIQGQAPLVFGYLLPARLALYRLVH